MPRFSDIAVFGPAAAIQSMQRQAANDEPEPDETKPEIEPEHDSNDARNHVAAREKALRRPWDISPP
jgi:hypothetical protein